MTRLDEVKRKSDAEIRAGAYYRCFGDVQIASIFSRVQGLVIKNGYELERLVTDYAAHLLIFDLDMFLQDQIMDAGVRLVEKKVIKKSNLIEGYGIEPDFMIFERQRSSQHCYIIELKDGHEFDTKSSAKESQNLRTFLSKNALPLQYYNSYCKIVGFNAQTHEEIVIGFKQKIAPDQAMTGAEFCELLGLDYEEIRAVRAQDRDHNLDQIIDELLLIDEVRTRIEEKLNGKTYENGIN